MMTRTFHLTITRDHHGMLVLSSDNAPVYATRSIEDMNAFLEETIPFGMEDVFLFAGGRHWWFVSWVV